MINQHWQLTVFIFFTFVSSVFPITKDSLSRLLPKDGEIEGWKRQRPVQHYVGEDLYEYIDGGAEIYHEYGFKQVAVQDYIHTAGNSVSVEIFEMSTAESAYGMYTFKTNGQGKEISLGNDAELADYYLNFWKGTFLVTLTGFDETDETIKGLLDIARRVEPKLEAGKRGEKPLIASLLPRESLKNRSLKYFKGLLGLRSSYPFFNLEIIGFEEGIKGDYGDGHSLFLFRFGGEGECRESFGRLKGQQAKARGYEEYAEWGTFLAEDSRNRRFFASSLGKFLLIGVGNIDRSKAEKIIQTFEKREKGTSHQGPPYLLFESSSPKK